MPVPKVTIIKDHMSGEETVVLEPRSQVPCLIMNRGHLSGPVAALYGRPCVSVCVANGAGYSGHFVQSPHQSPYGSNSAYP